MVRFREPIINGLVKPTKRTFKKVINRWDKGIKQEYLGYQIAKKE